LAGIEYPSDLTVIASENRQKDKAAEFMTSKFNSLLMFILVNSAVISGCDNQKKRQVDAITPGRKGERLIATELKYYDGKPSLSSDGSRVGFISGRDITDDGEPFLRSFSSVTAIGEEPAAPARITSNDLAASEVDVQISPDGLHAAILAQGNEQADLHLYDFLGQGVKITDSTDFEQGASFSADSAFLAWTTSVEAADGTARQTSISLVSVAEPTKIYSFAVDSHDAELLFWIPQTAGYEIVFSTSNSDSAGRILKAITFQTAAAFSSATAAAWGSAGDLKPLSNASVGRDFVVGTKGLARGAKSVPTFGDAESASAETVNVITEPVLLDRNGGVQADTKFAVGHRFLFASMSTVEDFGLFVSQVRIHCNGEADGHYGTSLFLYRGAASEVEPIVPISDTAFIPKNISASQCKPEVADAVAGVVDRRIASAKLNLGAIADKFRIVYESTESGDAEIRFIDSTDGSRKIRELSTNRK
jgi:hypothetical protein